MNDVHLQNNCHAEYYMGSAHACERVGEGD